MRNLTALPALTLIALQTQGETYSSLAYVKGGTQAETANDSPALRRTITADLRIGTSEARCYVQLEENEATSLPALTMSAEVNQTLTFLDRSSIEAGHTVLKRMIEVARCEQAFKSANGQTGQRTVSSPFESAILMFLDGEEGRMSAVVPVDTKPMRESLIAADWNLLRYNLPLKEIFALDGMKKQSWDVPQDLLDDVLLPGGNHFPTKRSPLRRPPADATVSEISWFFAGTVLKIPEFLSAPKGRVTVDYQGKQTVEGEELHVAEIDIDVTCITDCAPYMQHMLLAQLPVDRSYTYLHQVEVALRGGGTLLLASDASGTSSLRFDLRFEVEERLDVSTKLNHAVTKELGNVHMHTETSWQGDYKVQIVEAGARD